MWNPNVHRIIEDDCYKDSKISQKCSDEGPI